MKSKIQLNRGVSTYKDLLRYNSVLCESGYRIKKAGPPRSLVRIVRPGGALSAEGEEKKRDQKAPCESRSAL